MISFAAILFFSVTGITLNHPTAFGASTEHFRDLTGKVRPEWIGLGEQTGNSTTEETDAEVTSQDNDDSSSSAISRLEIVEYLRATDKVRGAVTEFAIDDYQIVITFRGPAYTADVFIDRESGDYELTEMSNGFVALINDLHKGRDTGKNWAWLIDVSAGLMTFVSLTGIVLIFYIKRHRTPGLLTTALGTILVFVCYFWFVPR